MNRRHQMAAVATQGLRDGWVARVPCGTRRRAGGSPEGSIRCPSRPGSGTRLIATTNIYLRNLGLSADRAGLDRLNARGAGAGAEGTGRNHDAGAAPSPSCFRRWDTVWSRSRPSESNRRPSHYEATRRRCTRLHSSPLTCGNALDERYYDGLSAASTATELHRAPPQRRADSRALRVLSDRPGAGRAAHTKPDRVLSVVSVVSRSRSAGP